MSRYLRRRDAPSLTSMIDVLFILLFASLARAAAPDTRESEAAPEATPVDAGATEADAAIEPDAGEPSPPSPVDYAATREVGLARALERLGERPALVLRISAAGELVAIEAGADQSLEVRVPLLERVPDRDVGLAYLGDRTPDLQLCAIAGRYVPLDGQLVVIAPAVPIDDLSVALVRGLRRDVERCAGALAVIADNVSAKERDDE